MADVFTLKAKLGLDKSEYDKGLGDAETKAKSAGSGIGTALGKTAAIAGAAITAAVGAAATGIGILMKQSVSAYSEYEQLAGGAELMFGEAYDFIADKAKNAYATVQMSQNEYLAQVNGFAVGLRESLGGNEQAAAELADKIITAEADIVAATGETQENIQNAFNGIMKGNYTMLDNLKLGITPTKEGMQEVIDKVNEWNEAQGNLTNYTIDNLADCEAAIVDYVSMVGMAGYANDEAAGTIQGSLSMLKGAWENLLTAFADPNADIGEAINAVVESATAAFGNLLPVIEQTLSGIGAMVQKIAPILSEQLPILINDILPSLIDTAITLVQGLVDALPAILPTLTDGAIQIVRMLASALPDILTAIIEILPDLIKQIVDTLIEMAPQLMNAAVEMIMALADGLIQSLPDLIPAIYELIYKLVNLLTDPENLLQLVDAALQIMMALVEGLINAIPVVMENAPAIIENLVIALINALPMILEAGVKIIGALIEGMLSMAGGLIEVIGTLLGDAFNVIGGWFENLFTSLGEWLSNAINTVVEWLSQLPEKMAYWAGFAIGSFIKFFMDLPENIATWFTETVQKVIEFGENFKAKAAEAGQNFFNNLVDNIKKLPQRLRQLGEDLLNAVKSLPDKFANIGRNIVTGLWNGISEKWQWLKDQVSNLANSLLQGAKDALGIASPSKEFAWVGRMVDEGFAKGIDNFAYMVDDAIDRVSSSLIDVAPLESMIGAVSVPAYADGDELSGVGGYNQIVNVYSPTQLDPSEVARQTRNATRDMVLGLRGKR